MGVVGVVTGDPGRESRNPGTTLHAETHVTYHRHVGPGLFMRITPTVSWSWNLAGEPAGDAWYEPHRTDHPAG